MASPEAVLTALSAVRDPELHRDLVSLNMVRDVVVDGGTASFRLVLTTPACPLREQIDSDVRAAGTRAPSSAVNWERGERAARPPNITIGMGACYVKLNFIKYS